MALAPGDAAPDFELQDQSGTTRKLSTMLADGPVVLFWYPKAMTTGCTAESCHFRDLAAEFAEVGAQRVGISADKPERQAQFDEKNSLGYPRLSDADRTVAKAYGVRRLVPFNKRATFVIGTDGKLVDVISSETNMEVHADQALEALKADRPSHSSGFAALSNSGSADPAGRRRCSGWRLRNLTDPREPSG